MDQIRLATVEEVEDKHQLLDITPTSTVVSFGGKDFAVVRDTRELDPILFSPTTGNQRKILFLMNLETALRLQGTKELYFNIPADDPDYIAVMRNWGAEPIKEVPMIRMKKVL